MKRDGQGKFALIGEELRSVRSLRLTDSTWEKIGIAAQAKGMTRADWLEELFSRQEQPRPCNTPIEESMVIPDERGKGWLEKTQPSPQAGLSPEDLEILAARALKGLRLGKQAPGYKVARKVLEQLLSFARDDEGNSRL
ncbi:MAG: hypothetical protein N5P05_004323 (plasmid) [Chroococcopsis gigantea SAG 12.99]|jgi:hypothetical protein|nr:hypothetical protein [Chroococcopsis gigantea SAG 12.99]MDV2999163.1 hypothetical protein [Chroococcopsis gigantea SAG 12.99]MDV3000027.1 hypothetical protein [Chroococcopsis gigantea SAG 12.99]MDV3001155.1 hypothetical protein [Chroococcopsis gigantea SAG 12.99]MDV3001404.1 hypothetical protein [Chroococcopsis gigantea SAG 12.99]